MNRVKYIRHTLRKVSENKMEEMWDSPDGMVGTIELVKKAGEFNIAEDLLELIPREESEIVKDYWAIDRVCDKDNLFSDEVKTYAGGEPTASIERAKYRIRNEAMGLIEERIEVEEIAEKKFLLKDPVSKMQLQCVTTKNQEVSERTEIENMKRQLAANVLDNGV